MAIVINSNIASLTAQKALGDSQKMQQTAMERLSTGLRINSAADDAAGMAIAEGFTSQIRGLSQAVRNANEALSLTQTAESSLQETTDILQRIRELAVQASNSTLTSSDRTAISTEVTALTAEIDRIATSTQYNNSNILDGSAKNLTFQIGDKVNQSVSLSIASATSSGLGIGSTGGGSSDGLIVGGKVTAPTFLEFDDILINGHSFTANTAGLTGSTITDPDTGVVKTIAYTQATAFGAAAMINTNTGNHGVTATAVTSFSSDAGTGVTDGTADVVLTGNGTATFTLSATSNMSELVEQLNGIDTNITATLNSKGGIDYVDTLGRTVVITGTTTQFGFEATTNTGHLVLKSVDGSSDITIGGADNLNDVVEPSANTITSGVGERKEAAFALGLNYGTYSYSGGTTVSTGQIADQLIDGMDTVTVNGVLLASTAAGLTTTTTTAGDIAAAFNAVSEESGVTAVAKNKVVLQMLMNSGSEITSTNANTLSVNGVSTTLTGNMAIATLVSTLQTNHDTANTGLRFTGIDDQVVIESDTGSSIRVLDAAAQAIARATHESGSGLSAHEAEVSYGNSETFEFRGFLELSNASGDIVIGTTATNDAAYATAEAVAENLGLALSKKSDVVSGGAGLNLSSATNASAAISSIDSALSVVNSIRGDLGAMSNRLDHSISNLTQTVENHTASRSRQMDADFAAESANLAKAQVLAQASTAMLAQANAAPQLALQLLQ
ncbi:MAG: hypothetical protein CMF52_08485 [Legionellales bacterium]|nr:hypothetical protein [Legionellales bacterium]